jgi:hypothetical protein
MSTFEVFWRGAILVILAFLTWNSFIAGGVMAGFLLLSCIPVWLFIGLYNQGYF